MSFEKKIHFIQHIKKVFVSIFTAMVIFIPWDIWFTEQKVWSFNQEYLSGLIIFKLPIEEWLFFITIPYALLFIYENIKTFLKTRPIYKIEQYINIILILVFLYTAAHNHDKIYTFVTFTLLGMFFIIKTILSLKYDIMKVYITYAISLLPFLIVNGLLTYLPIVNYNNSENLSIRILTIPLEDFFYGLLLFLINVSVYEYISKKQSVT